LYFENTFVTVGYIVWHFQIFLQVFAHQWFYSETDYTINLATIYVTAIEVTAYRRTNTVCAIVWFFVLLHRTEYFCLPLPTR